MKLVQLWPLWAKPGMLDESRVLVIQCHRARISTPRLMQADQRKTPHPAVALSQRHATCRLAPVAGHVPIAIGLELLDHAAETARRFPKNRSLRESHLLYSGPE
jgi:hypothetical protein